MKAVVYQAPRTVVVEEVADAKIETPTDALLRITSCAICGSDLHMYDGRGKAEAGLVFGHEPVGVVEEVGADVQAIKKGDRVAVPTHLNCGFCFNCARGYSAFCLTLNPGKAGAAPGYAGMGTFRGAHAELLRVPFADFNCLKLPGAADDEWENDFATLPDAFVTGWHATELAQVSVGDSVAIFGAGAVGILAAYSAILRGAGDVFSVDFIDDRLEKAHEFGAIPIDIKLGDPVEQIFEFNKKNRVGAYRRGEEVMHGVMRGIDVVGFQARDRKNLECENPHQVIGDLARLINPTGRLGIIGVYPDKDPQSPAEEMKHGELAVAWGSLFQKGVNVGFGRTNDKRYNVHLRDLIVSGKAKPGAVISKRLPLSEAPAAFAAFDKREAGFIKIVIDPRRF